MLAEGSLVALYIGFGARALPVRLAFSIPGVAFVFLPVLGLPDGPFAFTVGMIFVVVVAVPSVVARSMGWRVVRVAKIAVAPQPRCAPLQFTLGQLFSLTVAVAMVAGILRLLAQFGDGYLRRGSVSDLLFGGVVCLISGVIALGGVWGAFGRRRPIPRLLVVIGLSSLVPLLILLLTGANGQPTFMLVSMAAFDALFVSTALLSMRPLRFRLVRQWTQAPGQTIETDLPAQSAPSRSAG
jgi:hypothetical protein